MESVLTRCEGGKSWADISDEDDNSIIDYSRQFFSYSTAVENTSTYNRSQSLRNDSLIKPTNDLGHTHPNYSPKKNQRSFNRNMNKRSSQRIDMDRGYPPNACDSQGMNRILRRTRPKGDSKSARRRRTNVEDLTGDGWDDVIPVESHNFLHENESREQSGSEAEDSETEESTSFSENSSEPSCDDVKPVTNYIPTAPKKSSKPKESRQDRIQKEKFDLENLTQVLEELGVENELEVVVECQSDHEEKPASENQNTESVKKKKKPKLKTVKAPDIVVEEPVVFSPEKAKEKAKQMLSKPRHAAPLVGSVIASVVNEAKQKKQIAEAQKKKGQSKLTKPSFKTKN